MNGNIATFPAEEENMDFCVRAPRSIWKEGLIHRRFERASKCLQVWVVGIYAADVVCERAIFCAEDDRARRGLPTSAGALVRRPNVAPATNVNGGNMDNLTSSMLPLSSSTWDVIDILTHDESQDPYQCKFRKQPKIGRSCMITLHRVYWSWLRQWAL